MYDATVIGASVVDVLAAPVDAHVFETGSMPAEQIRLSFGGDALNEAVVLSRLGLNVQLISMTGRDEAGERVLGYMKKERLSTDSMTVTDAFATAVNIVLIDRAGNRHFVTDPSGTLRKLDLADIEPHLERAADIVSFASIFVSPLLTIDKLTYLFGRIKGMGKILTADMTKAKNGEKLADIRPMLPFIDVLVPNDEEIRLLTGEADPETNIQLLLEAGVKSAVIKCGSRGCVIGTKDEILHIPAVPGVRCVDTTGAGDTFTAGLIYGLKKGMSLKACADFACGAASCAIEQVGAVEGVTSIDEIMRRCRH